MPERSNGDVNETGEFRLTLIYESATGSNPVVAILISREVLCWGASQFCRTDYGA